MRSLQNIICVVFLSIGVSWLISCTHTELPETKMIAVPFGKTNVDFRNTLTQTGDFNIIEYLYFYNGGGVSTGDINNDGLTDIYFTGNQVPNKLYLNKGDFVFEDITALAGVSGVGNWKTGTAMGDVNGDGFLDIFVCGVGNYKRFAGSNQLFINNGDLTFTDRSAEYGMSFAGFSTHAAFFDYDNDGDLDVYLLNHSVHTARTYGHSRLRFQSDRFAGDKLYRNELIPEGRAKFTEVTSLSGIYNSQIGYGLGVGISDLNMDGFMDIYISNDFHENDYLYMNRGDGTFRENLSRSFSHVSRFSMGNDIADVNNDALPDIMTLDMLPRDEQVIKSTAGEDPYDIYNFKLRFGYHPQFARNCLQLNRGQDNAGNVLFSDIAPLAGVEASDWSWAPLLADFDNDGSKDLFIANGILTRPNDLDYVNFIATDSARKSYDHRVFINHMPPGRVPNLFFKNLGDLRFTDVSEHWIGKDPTLSTGAAYADLDNDGDLDLILNNINEVASIFRNEQRGGGWLQIDLKGEGANKFGIGTKILAYVNGKTFYHELLLSRGWQSSVSPIIHIGTGEVTSLDSIRIIWPSRKTQKLIDVATSQKIQVFEKDASSLWRYERTKPTAKRFLECDTTFLFKHAENDFDAFSREKLIPHMAATEGPGIATADVNRDGLQDFFVGGGASQAGAVFIQDKAGRFNRMHQPSLEVDSLSEDVASVFFDANRDGLVDLVVVSAGQEYSGEDTRLLPRLYIQNRSGIFRRAEGSLPNIFVNASCVKAADADSDGDLDLFIGGRVVPGQYGKDAESFLLLNDGSGFFRNESSRLGASAGMLGMVTDALWADLNRDEKPDLVVVGEWMPITILIQDESGHFSDETIKYGLDKTNGWWNTIYGEDFDGDGDTDFVAGNLGLNSRLRATVREPVTLYVGDMDDNGATDHLLTYFNQGKEYPFISRDQLVKQVPSFKRNFLKYSSFKNVTREHIIPADDTSNFIVKHAYTFTSVYLKNQGNTLDISSLPIEAQTFPVFSFASGDFNKDGHSDLLAAGNLVAVQPEFGRYDGGYGTMMQGDGSGYFESVPLSLSGFIVTGEGRDVEIVQSANQGDIVIVSRNNDTLLVFRRPIPDRRMH